MQMDLLETSNILNKIEELILDDNINYNSDQAAVLYSSLKQLRDCLEWVKNDMNYTAATRQKRIGHAKDLYELTRKIGRISETRVSHPIFDAINGEVKSLYDVITKDVHKTNSEMKIEIENKELRRELANQERYVKELADQFNERTQQVEQAANKLYEVGGRKTSKEWTDEYYKYVVYESSYVSYDLKKNKALPPLFIFVMNLVIWLRNVVMRVYSGVVRDKVLYNGLSYNNLVKKWQFWRSVWLLFLLAVALSYLIAFWSYDFSHRELTSYVLDKTKFIPLLVIVTVGFTFASRNYKINAHLLEQYKHRYVVAKTMSNLMTLDNLKDESITRELMQLGSKVLFEFRNSGYMSKQDGEGLPTQEILTLISKMNTKS